MCTCHGACVEVRGQFKEGSALPFYLVGTQAIRISDNLLPLSGDGAPLPGYNEVFLGKPGGSWLPQEVKQNGYTVTHLHHLHSSH